MMSIGRYKISVALWAACYFPAAAFHTDPNDGDSKIGRIYESNAELLTRLAVNGTSPDQPSMLEMHVPMESSMMQLDSNILSTLDCAQCDVASGCVKSKKGQEETTHACGFFCAPGTGDASTKCVHKEGEDHKTTPWTKIISSMTTIVHKSSDSSTIDQVFKRMTEDKRNSELALEETQTVLKKATDRIIHLEAEDKATNDVFIATKTSMETELKKESAAKFTVTGGVTGEEEVRDVILEFTRLEPFVLKSQEASSSYVLDNAKLLLDKLLTALSERWSAMLKLESAFQKEVEEEKKMHEARHDALKGTKEQLEEDLKEAIRELALKTQAELVLSKKNQWMQLNKQALTSSHTATEGFSLLLEVHKSPDADLPIIVPADGKELPFHKDVNTANAVFNQLQAQFRKSVEYLLKKAKTIQSDVKHATDELALNLGSMAIQLDPQAVKLEPAAVNQFADKIDDAAKALEEPSQGREDEAQMLVLWWKELQMLSSTIFEVRRILIDLKKSGEQANDQKEFIVIISQMSDQTGPIFILKDTVTAIQTWTYKKGDAVTSPADVHTGADDALSKAQLEVAQLAERYRKRAERCEAEEKRLNGELGECRNAANKCVQEANNLIAATLENSFATLRSAQAAHAKAMMAVNSHSQELSAKEGSEYLAKYLTLPEQIAKKQELLQCQEKKMCEDTEKYTATCSE